MSDFERCAHRAWRRWRITGRFATFLYLSGITSGGGSWRWGGGCNGCQSLPRFDFHKRPYVLWISRGVWRCWLVGHHRRGEPIMWDYCGKCIPWPCCGAVTEAHAPGCTEAIS